MDKNISDNLLETYYANISPQRKEELISRTKWLLSKVTGKKILMIGSQHDALPILLARAGKTIVTIESDAENFEKIVQLLKLERKQVSNRVTCIKTEFLKYKIPSEKFDCILANQLIATLPNPEVLLELCCEALTELGIFLTSIEMGKLVLRDHQRVFYFAAPYELLCRYFYIENVEIADRWVGFSSVLNGSSKKKPSPITPSQLKQIEASLIHSHAQISNTFLTTQKALTDTNMKYRQVTEQNSDLKHKLQVETAARKAAATTLQESLEERKQQRSELLLNKRHTESLLEDKTEKEGALNKLIEVNKENTFRILSLAHELEMNSLKVKLELNSSELRIAKLQSDLKVSQLQIENNTSELEYRTAQNQKLEATLLAVRTRLKNVINEEIPRIKRVARSKIAEAESKAERCLDEKKAAESRAQDLLHQIEIEKLSNQYFIKNLETETEKLKVILEDEYAQKTEMSNREARELKSENARLIDEISLLRIKAKKELGDVQTRLQLTLADKVKAESKVVKTRASISFRLGYLLLQSLTSTKAFCSLPNELWKLRKETLKRKKEKQLQLASLEPIFKKVSPLIKGQSTASTHILAQSPALVTPPITETEVAQQASFSLLKERNRIPQLQVKPKTEKYRVAGIMDEFSFYSYSPECQLLPLTPGNFRQELEDFKPDFLFIESAWRGQDNLWDRKIGFMSSELMGILEWCNTRSIPTLFWNKEDPIHFETFINTAKFFDHVFTTDLDCISKYKKVLDHERVYLLPFAVQPKTHNPIEKYERKDAISFAGAYYTRYPDRNRDLDSFLTELSTIKPFDIFDRNFGKDDPNYQFPEMYQKYIVGTLPFEEIDKAYKGYKYSVNLNSIKQSQSMFARRVYELLASNTIVFSNFSKGLRLFFGDLVTSTDSGMLCRQEIERLQDEDTLKKKCLVGLRKVMREHTYTHRFNYILTKLANREFHLSDPKIAIISFAEDSSQLERILQSFYNQNYSNCELKIVLAEHVAKVKCADSRVDQMPNDDALRCKLRDLIGADTFVGTFSASDYYGPNYLVDLSIATKYGDYSLLGKSSFFSMKNNRVVLQHSGARYQVVDELDARCSIIKASLLGERTVFEFLDRIEVKKFKSNMAISIDEFNYCRNTSTEQINTGAMQRFNDEAITNQGLGIESILAGAEQISADPECTLEGPTIAPKSLFSEFKCDKNSTLQINETEGEIIIRSSLPDSKHEYIYNKPRPLSEFQLAGEIKFYLETTPGLNIQLAIFFLDKQKQKISHVIKAANRNHTVEVPLGAEEFSLALRIYSSGTAKIKGLYLSHRRINPTKLIPSANCLVLTNHYPSYDDLYRNPFVHSRVKSYRDQGLACDVFRFRPNEENSFHEYENVDVTTGPAMMLNKALSSGKYRTVLVHFLDSQMWEVLKNYIDDIRIIVWLHGAEIQPAYRRAFNYKTCEEQSIAEMKSTARMTFWKELLKEVHPNLKLVFVSQYFANEVIEDLGFKLPSSAYTVIHNPINTCVFRFQEKEAEQRKKILSISSYSSKTYATDLSVQAIIEMSKRPYFSDLEFRLIGDGILFDEVLAPVKHFPNVFIQKGFLNHKDISLLHKEYGVFLCPTRTDTHGVSRDEAMSSGLVPVTNAVAAIPEFTDDSCAILAKSEDSGQMAEGLSRIIESPELFKKMSAAAARRVRSQSAAEIIISKELAVIDASMSETAGSKL